MIKIRHYNNSDYEILSKWWNDHKEIGPTKDMLPEESTFVLEYNGKPCVSITAYLTNSKEISYLENLISDPELKNKEIRNTLTQIIVDDTFGFLRGLGYKRVICFSYKDGLKERYKEMGMTKTLDNLSSFARVL